MAVNFDMNKIRYVTRGEVSGSARFLVLFLCAATAWIGSYWLLGMARSASSTATLWQGRYTELSHLAAEYKALAPASSPHGEVEVMTAFNQVAESIELGSRVRRITPVPGGNRCVVEITRIYSEELTDVVRGLAARGVKVFSAELNAIPVGEERLFNMTAIIGTES